MSKNKNSKRKVAFQELVLNIVNECNNNPGFDKKLLDLLNWMCRELNVKTSKA